MIKRLGIGVASILAIGATTFFVGPRIEDEVYLENTELPADLDAYLADSESKVEGIREGTQKEIIWANPEQKDKTPVSMVYVHGFTASRGETFPLCDSLANELGANLFYTRLQGHGISGEAFGTSTFNGWANDPFEAYRIGQQIGERVILVATSMGGALSTWLMAQEETSDPLALILISPCYGLYDKNGENTIIQLTQLPWASQIAEWSVGEYVGDKKDDAKVDHFWTSPYKTKGLLPLGQLMAACREIDFEQFNFPLFMIYSPEDQVVDAQLIANRYVEFGSTYKDSIQILNANDPKNHVLAGQYLSENTTEHVRGEIMEFLKPLTEEQKRKGELRGRTK